MTIETYRGMIIGERIVDGHIFEETAHELLEKAFYLAVIVFRIDKERSNVGLDYIRKGL